MEEINESIEPIQEDLSINEIYQEEHFNVTETTTINQEPILEENVMEEEKTAQQPIYIKVNFPRSATPVDCVSATTNCSDKIVASNKQLALLQNRFYFIPVDCSPEVNSDTYSVIKVYSEYADAIDIRYIKNGVACIMPLRHNFKIKQDMVIAILF